jgi:hypothetical protein
MRRRLTWLSFFSAAIMTTAFYHAENVHATAAEGSTATTLALGRLGANDVSNYLVPPKGSAWLSLQKTQGPSDL